MEDVAAARPDLKPIAFQSLNCLLHQRLDVHVGARLHVARTECILQRRLRGSGASSVSADRQTLQRPFSCRFDSSAWGRVVWPSPENEGVVKMGD